MIHYVPSRMVWRQRVGTERLEAILAGWAGTPYMAGQAQRGVGVDCVRFVCAVLDELQGVVREVATLPSDAAMHTRRGAIGVMRTIRKRFAPNDPVRDGSLEPGDVIVVGPSDGGPGHAMIVGTRKNELWHSTGRNVHRSGLAFAQGYNRVFRVYRMRGLNAVSAR